MDQRLLNAAALVAAMLATGYQTEAAVLEKVVDNTDVPAVGTSGSIWAATNAFGSAWVDNSGAAGFRGSLISSSTNQVVVYGTPSSLVKVARSNETIQAGIGSGTLTQIQTTTLPLSPNGKAWFGGNSSAVLGFISTGTPLGLTKVAARGDTMPGTGAGTLSSNPSSTSNYSNVNNAAQTVIACDFNGGTTNGAWVGNTASKEIVYLRNTTYSSLSSVPVKGVTGGAALNGSGNVYSGYYVVENGFTVTINNNEYLAIKPYGGSNNFIPIAREGSAAPGTAGANYLSAGTTSLGGLPPLIVDAMAFTMAEGNLNNSNHTLFSVGLAGGDVSGTTNNAAMFYYDGTATQLFRRKGAATTAVPGALLNIGAAQSNQARLNNNDSIAWTSTLVTGTGGVTASNDTVVLQTAAGSATDTLIAREGFAVGSSVPGALFGGSLSSVMQNNANQIVFVATLADDTTNANDNVTSANDLGLFAWLPGSGLQLIAREGQDLTSIGIDMSIANINISGVLANAEGGAGGLSDTGWLAFMVTGNSLNGSSDTSAVLRVQVPEPASLSLVGISFGMLLRRRRA